MNLHEFSRIYMGFGERRLADLQVPDVDINDPDAREAILSWNAHHPQFPLVEMLFKIEWLEIENLRATINDSMLDLSPLPASQNPAKSLYSFGRVLTKVLAIDCQRIIKEKKIAHPDEIFNTLKGRYPNLNQATVHKLIATPPSHQTTALSAWNQDTMLHTADFLAEEHKRFSLARVNKAFKHAVHKSLKKHLRQIIQLSSSPGDFNVMLTQNKLGNFELRSWGNNEYSQLGLDQDTEITEMAANPRLLQWQPPTGSQSVLLQTGFRHTTVAFNTPEGAVQVYAWGFSYSADVSLPRPTLINDLALPQGFRPRYLACGNDFTVLALTAADKPTEIRAWGKNDWGQLGQGHKDPVAGSVSIPCKKEAEIALLSSSDCYTAMLLQEGLQQSLWTWGDNTFGQLGCGKREDQYRPTEIDIAELATSKITHLLCHPRGLLVIARDPQNRLEFYSSGAFIVTKANPNEDDGIRMVTYRTLKKLKHSFPIKTKILQASVSHPGYILACADEAGATTLYEIKPLAKKASAEPLDFLTELGTEAIWSMQPGTQITHLASAKHGLVARANKALKTEFFCWGDNSQGQCGLGYPSVYSESIQHHESIYALLNRLPFKQLQNSHNPSFSNPGLKMSLREFCSVYLGWSHQKSQTLMATCDIDDGENTIAEIAYKENNNYLLQKYYEVILPSSEYDRANIHDNVLCSKFLTEIETFQRVAILKALQTDLLNHFPHAEQMSEEKLQARYPNLSFALALEILKNAGLASIKTMANLKGSTYLKALTFLPTQDLKNVQLVNRRSNQLLYAYPNRSLGQLLKEAVIREENPQLKTLNSAKQSLTPR